MSMFVCANQTVLRPADPVIFIYSVLSISWSCDRATFEFLYQRAQAFNAQWKGEFWNFPDEAALEAFFAADVLRTWRRIPAYRRLEGEAITVHVLPGQCGYAYTGSARMANHCFHNFWLPADAGARRGWWQSCPMVVQETIYDYAEKLRALGADVTVVPATAVAPVRIELDRVSVRIACAPGDEPAHFLVRLNWGSPLYKRGRKYSDGDSPIRPWDGTIVSSRGQWDAWRQFLEARNIPWTDADAR